MTEASEKRLSYILLSAPALLVYTAVVVAPLFYSFILGFTKWNGYEAPSFVGLDNYVKLLTDPVFLHSLRNNLLIIAVSLFGQIPIAFILAYILHRKLIRGTQFFQGIIFFPTVITAVVVAQLFKQIFSINGIFTKFQQFLYDDPTYFSSIFSDKTYAIVPILFVMLWMYTGTYLIIFLANLQKIPQSTIEAAIIDGASERQILTSIILPSMSTILFTTCIFAIAGSLKSYDLIWAMTQGGPARYTEVVSIYMLQETFRFSHLGYGNAIAVFLVALSIGLIVFLQKLLKIYEKRYV